MMGSPHMHPHMLQHHQVADSRLIVQWPHPSFRFMFLGDPLKHQLSDLLHKYRAKGTDTTHIPIHIRTLHSHYTCSESEIPCHIHLLLLRLIAHMLYCLPSEPSLHPASPFPYSGIAITTPYRDKGAPNACLLMEGSADALTVASAHVNNYFTVRNRDH